MKCQRVNTIRNTNDTEAAVHVQVFPKREKMSSLHKTYDAEVKFLK